MKKLILISALLLFASNGWAECDKSDPTIVYLKCLERERAAKAIQKRTVSEINGLITQKNRFEGVNELDKKFTGSLKNAAISVGIGRNNTLAYSLCSNYETESLAIACAEVSCRKIGNNCRAIQVNDAYAKNGMKHSQMIMEKLGWDDNQSYSQPRATNNQSQQQSLTNLCLQRQALARKNYTCSPTLTKQGGLAGFAVVYNACQSERARMFPDSACFGASQPRLETPQQNNSVQLCNFKCWGGQIVQGDCNSPAVTVNGGMCPRM